jgi:hypothetical protein
MEESIHKLALPAPTAQE